MTIFTRMERMTVEERLLSEARRHSLWMLLCIISMIWAVIGLAMASQAQCGWMVAVCALAAVLLICAAIHHALESSRLLNLYDQHLQFSQPSGNGAQDPARGAEQI